MDLFLVYLWLKLDTISSFTALVIVVCVCCIVALGITIANAYDDMGYSWGKEPEAKARNLARIAWAKKWNKVFFISILCFSLFKLVLPSSKDVAILVGVHYVNKAIETPEAAKVQTLLRLKANELLDKQIQEATKDHKN